MKTIVILLFLTSCLFANCQRKNLGGGTSNEKYDEFKQNFPHLLIDQFPPTLEHHVRSLISKINYEKNDIILVLCQDGLSKNEIDIIKNRFLNNVEEKYNYLDSCIFKINMFESIETNASREIAVIEDTNQINRSCYLTRLPVPNFIEYSDQSEDTDFRIDFSYEIWVIDAKRGKKFNEFNLGPNPQMPKEWKNGYSKGIAFSETEGVILYWSAIW